MNAREQRGFAIATTCRVERDGKIWRVPSQSGVEKTYRVNPVLGMCSCPDHIETGEKCKHQYAVQFTMSREVHADGTVTDTAEIKLTKKTTFKQDWPKYNAAQTNEGHHFQSMLADLCSSLTTLPARRGQQPLPPSDAAFCAVYKTYSLMSARRFMSDLEGSKESGFVTRVPHFNSVLNFFDAESSTDILTEFVDRTAAPLVAIESDFAVDSTGFASSRYARWYDEKYGGVRAKVEWLKLHAMVGVRTNVITSCKVTGKEGADSPQFPELVERSSRQFSIGQMSADKAYGSEKNFAAVQKAGGEFYPAFKDNTTGGIGGAFEKAYHLMCLNKDEYMKNYHKRSNAESTFSALKRKFGESLRSKNEVSMRNEILAKVVAYNITCVIQEMYTLGINPEFVVKPRCTTNENPAQRLAF